MADLLIHMYNTHPLFESATNGQNCAYYTPDFMVSNTNVTLGI